MALQVREDERILAKIFDKFYVICSIVELDAVLRRGNLFYSLAYKSRLFR